MEILDTKRIDHLSATLKILRAGGGKYDVVLAYDNRTDNATAKPGPRATKYTAWGIRRGCATLEEARNAMMLSHKAFVDAARRIGEI